MRILMFGWEFPPRMSGGLGTACFGMTAALAGQRQSDLHDAAVGNVPAPAAR